MAWQAKDTDYVGRKASRGIVAAYGSRPLRLTVAFSTNALGAAVFTRWILPFEAVSVLLLAALVGAIVLARKD